jgi:predicted ATPase
VYVVEDAHWIDEVSESMLAAFLTVIPQTPSVVLVTYRAEYEGALVRVHDAQTIALGPLSDPETAALITELLGPDRSGGGLGQTSPSAPQVTHSFAEEIVHELAERGVLCGERGAYISTTEVVISVCLPSCRRPSPRASIGSNFCLAGRFLSHDGPACPSALTQAIAHQ